MKKTLHITISKNWQADMQADIDAIEKGIETPVYGLSFASAGLFFKDLTEDRWNLVRSLIGQKPLSMPDIAHSVGREQQHISDDIKILTELGLLEENDGNLWHCPYDDIHIDMHLAAA